MTPKHENLSAFVDGEGQDENFVKTLVNDAELSARWHRYHIIRQSLRKEMPEQADFDISGSVMAALQSEPAILAPKRTWKDLPVISNVIPLVRSSGQLAIAASVAVAVIFGFQQVNNQPETQIFNPAPASFTGIQGGLSPVSLEQTRVMPNVSVEEQQRRFNMLMNDHMNQVMLKNTLSSTPEKAAVESSAQERQPDVSQERENLPE
ncbi:sigma-E factor negative regulatory protein [Aliiglaciecola litoralis]|uniref:Anti-sigma-E factor RseA n=1 Tax=Aliiglaciecola litoralis TaxID=582857 RepID=A0ABP3WZ88_9ALTE